MHIWNFVTMFSASHQFNYRRPYRPTVGSLRRRRHNVQNEQGMCGGVDGVPLTTLDSKFKKRWSFATARCIIQHEISAEKPSRNRIRGFVGSKLLPYSLFLKPSAGLAIGIRNSHEFNSYYSGIHVESQTRGNTVAAYGSTLKNCISSSF